jgi:hypothetical protein
MIFGVANFDFVTNTLKNSIKLNTNPLESALEATLLQKSYHPFFPLNNNLDESIDRLIRVDYRYLSKLNLEIIPDVIITQSQMKHFTRVSNSTLFLNPGYFYKGDNLGYVCKLMTHSPSVKKNF